MKFILSFYFISILPDVIHSEFVLQNVWLVLDSAFGIVIHIHIYQMCSFSTLSSDGPPASLDFMTSPWFLTHTPALLRLLNLGSLNVLPCGVFIKTFRDCVVFLLHSCESWAWVHTHKWLMSYEACWAGRMHFWLFFFIKNYCNSNELWVTF